MHGTLAYVNGLTMDTSLKLAVGGKTGSAIERAFGYRTVRELLEHYPRRYSRRGELTPLTGLPVGEHVTIVAQVLDVVERKMQSRRGSLLEVRVTDGAGHLNLTFFNQSWRQRELRPGVRGQFAGKVKEYRNALQLQHPDYELFPDVDAETAQGVDARALQEAAALAYSKKLVPVYPATANLPSWAIAKTIALVIEQLPPLEEWVPFDLAGANQLMPLDDAIRAIHQPESDADSQEAVRSLKMREAFALQLALLHRKRSLLDETALARPSVQEGYVDRLDQTLPFQLTSDQVSAGHVIAEELSRSSPMNRMLQGEVGSGKTIVALRAMLQVADNDGQSALLAPTEVLASQHLRSITQALGPELTEQLKPTLLTGKLPLAERKRAMLEVASGTAKIVVGTHALMSEKTTFADLGLTIIDEQHRFGVEQREALRQKSRVSPHVLAMTATPIPRTIALTVFGDLDISTIRQLPPGRQPIETFAIQVHDEPNLETLAWMRAAEEIAEGRGVYVVCPAISSTQVEETGREDSDGRGKGRANVEDVASQLRKRKIFQGVRITELTGAMAPEDKERVMRAFERGEIDLLVATTVIEVGVNVPNASLMIVLEADRFGVSQLHQLRGRVGRGAHPGLCLLLSEAAVGSETWARIAAVASTVDGFALADIDLDLRREGDILGTKQSGGKSTLKLLRVARDGETIELAHDWAERILDEDPELLNAPRLRAIVEREDQHLDQLAKS